jgi:hypothetical protein
MWRQREKSLPLPGIDHYYPKTALVKFQNGHYSLLGYNAM